MNRLTEPALTMRYCGYHLVAQLDRTQAEDGSPRHLCQLTASELSEHPDALVFTRTLLLGDAQAAVMNTAQPGKAPPLERLQAELVQHGLRYMQALIDVVNRGFRAIAPAGTRSVSDARAFLGMTDAALQTREG